MSPTNIQTGEPKSCMRLKMAWSRATGLTLVGINDKNLWKKWLTKSAAHPLFFYFTVVVFCMISAYLMSEQGQQTTSGCIPKAIENYPKVSWRNHAEIKNLKHLKWMCCNYKLWHVTYRKLFVDKNFSSTKDFSRLETIILWAFFI